MVENLLGIVNILLLIKTTFLSRFVL